jgi:hypothetical protein
MSALVALRIAVSPEGQTVEHLFAQSEPPLGSRGSVAHGRSSDGAHGALYSIKLCPVDAEACLSCGIDPHDLFARAIGEFSEGTSDLAIAQLVRGTPPARRDMTDRPPLSGADPPFPSPSPRAAAGHVLAAPE